MPEETTTTTPQDTARPATGQDFLLSIADQIRNLSVQLSAVALSATDFDREATPALQTVQDLATTAADELARIAQSATTETLEQSRQVLESLAIDDLLRTAQGLLNAEQQDSPLARAEKRSIWDIIKCILNPLKCVVEVLLGAFPGAGKIFQFIYNLLCCLTPIICCFEGEGRRGASAAA